MKNKEEMKKRIVELEEKMSIAFSKGLRLTPEQMKEISEFSSEIDQLKSKLESDGDK